jgi:amino acid permease
VVCTALVLPLALKRQLNELRWCSVGLVVCVLFYVCSVIYKTLDALSRDGVAPDVAAAHFDNNIFRALPVIAFAAYHHVYALPIFREMKDPTPERFARVERVTFFIIEVWYLVPALLSYLVFGPEVAGNNLDNFRGDLLMSVVTGGYLLIIVFVFPLALFAVRLNLHFLVFGETETITRMQHWSETLLLFGGAMAIGLSVSDVSLVFSLIGAVSTSLLAFILPAVLLLRSAKTASSELEKTGARLVVFFGIVLAVLGVVTTFLDGLGITF